MKLVLAALLVAAVGATFLDFLAELQQHHSFQRLSEEEKLLFGGLVVAAENNELSVFIHRMGLPSVLELMDHMSHTDAHQFSAYLAEHSNYTHHTTDNQDVINKRDEDDHHDSLHRLLERLEGEYYEDHLPRMERDTLNGLRHAAASRNLNQYIDSVGYGAIFGLLEYLDSSHSQQVSNLINLALAAEAAAAAPVVKRQSNTHSNFYNYLSQLNSRYYDSLPAQEQSTYHALKDAVEAKTLTAYFDTNGYGPLFGFLEHLDSYHANQVYDYVEKALESEAAAAAQSDK